jgi:hypothetical protein
MIIMVAAITFFWSNMANPAIGTRYGSREIRIDGLDQRIHISQ